MKKIMSLVILVILCLSTFSILAPQVKAQATSSTSDPTDDLYYYQTGSPAGSLGAPFIDIIYAEISQVDSANIRLSIKARQPIPLTNHWQGYNWLLDTGIPAPPYWNPHDSNDINVAYSVQVNWAANGALYAQVKNATDETIIFYEDFRDNPSKYFSGDTVSVTIPLSWIGNPTSIKWVAGSTDGRASRVGRHDKAPNTGHVTLTIAPTASDFEISISPESQTVEAGESVSYEVSLTPLNGFDSEVSLFSGWVGTPPAGEVPSLILNPLHLSPPGSSSFTVDTYIDTQLGQFTIEITAVSGSITHSVEVDLTIVREIYKVAYLTVVYSDTSPLDIAGYSFNSMERRAELVKGYYYSQSMGAVAIERDFPFEDEGWHPLEKTFEEYWQYGAWWEIPQVKWGRIVDAAKIDAQINDDYDAIVVVQSQDLRQAFAFSDMGVPGKIIVLDWGEFYGTWAHELGHALLKFKDYYSGDILQNINRGGDVKYWGLMGEGNLLRPPAPIMSWNKISAGWLTKTYVGYGEHKIDLLENMNLNDETIFFTNWWVNYDYMSEGRFPSDGVNARDPEPGANENTLVKTRGITLYKIEYSKTGLPLRVVVVTNPEDDRMVTLVPGEDPYIDDLMMVKFSAITKESEEDLYVNIEGHTIFDRMVVALESIEFEIPGISSLFAAVGSGSTLDVDLHAFTADGQRVGMNYSSGTYELGIQEARASGNIPGAGPEWISLPDDVLAYFTIDATPAREFAQEHNLTITSITANVSVVHYDEFGSRSQSRPIPLDIDVEKPTILTDLLLSEAIDEFQSLGDVLEPIDSGAYNDVLDQYLNPSLLWVADKSYLYIDDLDNMKKGETTFDMLKEAADKIQNNFLDPENLDAKTDAELIAIQEKIVHVARLLAEILLTEIEEAGLTDPAAIEEYNKGQQYFNEASSQATFGDQIAKYKEAWKQVVKALEKEWGITSGIARSP